MNGIDESKIIDAEFTPVETSNETVESSPVAEAPTTNPISENMEGVVNTTNELQYAKYNTADLDKYLESMGELNYVELTQLETSLKRDMTQLEETKTLVDALREMKLDDSMNREMMQTNVLLNAGIQDDVWTFNEQYPKLKFEYDRTLERITEELKRYDSEEKKGTRFFTEQMVEILQKKLAVFETPTEDGLIASKNEMMAKKYHAAIEAFTNRDDFSYLENAIKTTLSNKRTMRAFWKDCREKVVSKSNAISFYMSDLKKSFNDDQIGRLVEFLTNAMKLSLTEIHLLFFVFSRVLKKADEGCDTYVKVFVLNILDYMSDGYDYYERPESTKDEATFLKDIKHLCTLVSLW